jgi:hypothetical protein
LSVREWTDGAAWRGRADTTANALSVLQHYDFQNKDHVWSRSIEILKQLAKVKRDRVVWGTNVSTAYVLYSIVESPLWEDKDLRDLSLRASSGLLLARREGHWGPEEPPYGGRSDIVSPEFFTAAIIRGVCAVEAKRDHNFILEVQAALRQKRASHAQELERRIIDIREHYEQSINKEVEKRLKEKASALDLRKLSIKDLPSHFSIGTLAFLASLIIGAGALGWSLSESFGKRQEGTSTSGRAADSSKASEQLSRPPPKPEVNAQPAGNAKE